MGRVQLWGAGLIGEGRIEVGVFAFGHAGDEKDDRAEHGDDDQQHHQHRIASGHGIEMFFTRAHTDGAGESVCE